MIYGLILAAGLSSRMGGSPKALRGIGSASMLARCAAALGQGGADRILVVTGHRREEVRAASDALGLETVHNPGYEEGMFTSLCAGFAHIAWLRREAAASGPAAVLLLPVDAPLAQAWSVRALSRYWRDIAAAGGAAADKSVFIPCFGGRGGHPPLIGAAHTTAVLKRKQELQSDGGLRAYLATLVREEFRQDFAKGLSPAPPQVPDGADAPPPPGHGLPCLPIQAGPGLAFIPMPDAGVAGDLDRPEDCQGAEEFLALTRDRTMPSPEECLEWLRGSCIGENKFRHCVCVAAGAFLLGDALKKAGRAVDLPLIAAGGLLHDLVRKCVLADKKCKAHARRAMDLIRERGWGDCALVVGAHTVLPDGILASLGIGLQDIQVMCRMRPKCPGGQHDELLFSETPALPDPHDPDIGQVAGRADERIGEQIDERVALACTAVYLADKFLYMDRFVPMDERFDVVVERFHGDEKAIQAISHRKRVAGAVNAWFATATGRPAELLLGECAQGMRALASKSPGDDRSADAVWLRFLVELLNGIRQ